MKKIIAFIVFLVLCGCNKSEDSQFSSLNQTIPADLLFSSGFENNTHISDSNNGDENLLWPDYDIIKGTDLSTGFSWPIQILGSDFGGIHRVNDDLGAAVENDIVKVIDYNGDFKGK